MKNLDEITKEELDNIKVVTFDVDGVIIPTGTNLKENEDGTELYMKSYRLTRAFIDNLKKLKKHILLNFSSGRNFLYLKSLTNEFFDNKIILQAENGAITWVDGKITHDSYEQEYFNKLSRIKEKIKEMMKNEKGISGFEPKMFILTVHCDKMREIPDLVAQMDLEKELYCLWTNEGYDIGHKEITKGKGIADLAAYLKINPKQIMTTGNNFNDAEMLEIGKGVTVDPDRVGAEYFIEHKPTELGGELLAEFLLKRFEQR